MIKKKWAKYLALPRNKELVFHAKGRSRARGRHSASSGNQRQDKRGFTPSSNGASWLQPAAKILIQG